MRRALPPVIKWPGSKRSMALFISDILPIGGTYFEPFLGGGAILGTQAGRQAHAADVVPELIEIWRSIQSCPDDVVSEYSRRWHRMQHEGYTAYYAIRDAFNLRRNQHDLLFLSRTCVNGLIRFNKTGNFNNSLHHTRRGIEPERFRSVVTGWSKAIQQVQFRTEDFQASLERVQARDVVFLDPPYVGTRGRYHPAQFNFSRLWDTLDHLNRVGAFWILTLDGTAGERDYGDQWVPSKLYQTRLCVSTGSSPFIRLMEGRVDKIRESVFLNFNPDEGEFGFAKNGDHSNLLPLHELARSRAVAPPNLTISTLSAPSFGLVRRTAKSRGARSLVKMGAYSDFPRTFNSLPSNGRGR
jgi:DNA adenine methylase